MPLTRDLPKPLLGLGEDGSTILGRLVSQCQEFLPGVPLYVNISYKGEKILEKFLGLSYKTRPTFLYEKELLGPSETLKQFAELRGGRTLILHGDLVLSSGGLLRFIEAASKTCSQMIVCHRKNRSEARSEVILASEPDRMRRIHEISPDVVADGEKTTELVLVSSGLFVVDLSRLESYTPRRNESLSPNLLNHINQSALKIYVWDDWRFAIDSTSILEEAQKKICEELDS